MALKLERTCQTQEVLISPYLLLEYAGTGVRTEDVPKPTHLEVEKCNDGVPDRDTDDVPGARVTSVCPALAKEDLGCPQRKWTLLEV